MLFKFCLNMIHRPQVIVLAVRWSDPGSKYWTDSSLLNCSDLVVTGTFRMMWCWLWRSTSKTSDEAYWTSLFRRFEVQDWHIFYFYKNYSRNITFSSRLIIFWALSKEVSSTIFKVFGMMWPRIEPVDEHSTH